VPTTKSVQQHSETSIRKVHFFQEQDSALRAGFYEHGKGLPWRQNLHMLTHNSGGFSLSLVYS